MKKIFVLTVAVAISLASGMQTNAQRILGGYRSASTDNASVVEAAEFAVSKRSETTDQEGLKLDAIEKAETQSAAGTNFRLCLTVILNDERQQVTTVVHRNLQQEHTLRSWEVVDSCGEREPGDVKAVKSAVPPTKNLPDCAGRQLILREAEGEADMGGKRFGNYVFTNASSRSCTLSGFPTFVPLSKSGKVIRGVEVKYDNDFVNDGAAEGGGMPAEITVGPRKTAWFQIFYNDGMALDRKKPFPVSSKIKVTATKDKRAFILKSAIQACCGVQVSSIRGGLPQ